MGSDQVFWVTSTLAQSISALYGLVLVYYVFVMNNLNNMLERIRKDEIDMRGRVEGQANPGEVDLLTWFSLQVHKKNVIRSYLPVNRLLSWVSLGYFVAMEVDMFFMLSVGYEIQSILPLIASLGFVGALSFTFVIISNRRIEENEEKLDIAVQVGNARLVPLKKIGYTKEELRGIGHSDEDLKEFDI